MTGVFFDKGPGLAVSWFTPPDGWVESILGWTLCGPRWVTLVLLVVTTYMLVSLIRWLTIPRDRWEQLLADEHRLRQRLRTHRQSGDREALTRSRHIRRRVAQAKLRTELPAHLLCILMTWSLFTWGNENVGYHSIEPDMPVDISVELPVSQIGRLIRLSPSSEIEIEDGPIRIIEVAGTGTETHGIANWTIRTNSGANRDVALHFRSRDDHWEHLLSGNGCHTPRVWIPHEDGVVTRLNIPRFDPFEIGWLLPASIPPWSVAYFALLVPGVIRVTWPRNTSASRDL